MSEWQPIETSPKDGTRVLIFNGYGAMDIAGYVEQFTERLEFVRSDKDGDVYQTVRNDFSYWDTDIAYDPTHWMPLPEPPK